MNTIKNKLIETFRSEENIGIYFADGQSGLTEAKHKELYSAPYDEVAYLPNGESFAICTNSAHYVVSQLESEHTVRVFGFFTEDNPVENDEIMGVGGHDFAVVDDRYIVDLWLSLYTGESNQAIFDLKDPADQDKIIHYYGSPERWSLYQKDSHGLGGFIECKSSDVPRAIVERLTRSLNSLDDQYRPV